MTRVALYLRVSGAAQNGPDAYGMEAQEADCRAYAERAGLEVAEVYAEVVSGRNGIADRTELPALVDAVDAGKVDGVLAARLDRVARSLTTQEAILGAIWSRGGVVHVADYGEVPQDDPDDPARTAMRQMMGVFAELERAMIAGRLRKGRELKRERGGYGGGFRTQVPADVDALALALRREGETLRGIAAKLDESGHPPPRGDRWAHSSIPYLIRRAERAERGRQA